MVTTCYSDQQGSKSRQFFCQVQLPENVGNLSASRRCLWVRTTVYIVIVWSFASIISESGLQATEKTVWCAAHPPESIKNDPKSFLAIVIGGITRRQVKRHFTSNGNDQCQNGLSNRLTPSRAQPRSARTV